MNALSRLILVDGSQAASWPSKPMLCLDRPLLLEPSDLCHLKIRSTEYAEVTAALMLATIEN